MKSADLITQEKCWPGLVSHVMPLHPESPAANYFEMLKNLQVFQRSILSNTFQTTPSFLPKSRFFSGTAIMGMTAFFDVEYTDAALDKARADAKRSGGTVPPRKCLPHLTSGSAQYLSHQSIRGEHQLTGTSKQPRKAASTSSSTTM